jgi:bifunctional DNA-binding transcriptional regulator/antitoxin component of YhaV-PrlF toxin-antitoxin module
MLRAYWSLTVLKTRLSSKGQIILPKSLRDARSWEAGMEFAVEPTETGVLLSPTAASPPARLIDVAGCLLVKRRSLFLKEAVWIAKTVLLETAWVMQHLYGLEAGALCSALQKLLGLPNAFRLKTAGAWPLR